MPVAARSSSFSASGVMRGWLRFGAEDAGGMGVEGDGDGWNAEGAGACDDLGDDPLVAAMDAVEVADGGDGWAEVWGDSASWRKIFIRRSRS